MNRDRRPAGERSRSGWHVTGWMLGVCALVGAGCAGVSSEPSAPIATASPVDVAGAGPDAGDAALGDGSGTGDGDDDDEPAVVEIREVLSTVVGSCEDVGITMRLEGERCHVLGEEVAIGPVREWVADAVAESRGELGWVVSVDVRPGAYEATRDAFEAVDAARYALVVDGRGMLEFGYGALALESSFGPLLSEREALTVAAVLRGEPRPDIDRPEVDVGDTWLAVLGVSVCGEWIDDAPATSADAGVHAHGDGLVYVHPTRVDGPDKDTGDDAILGRFLAAGGWHADERRLALWGGVEVENGDRCPDGRTGVVRWTVDGDEGVGDPSEHEVAHREVIVLSFGPLDDDPGEPPQLAALPVPMLGPDSASAGG